MENCWLLTDGLIEQWGITSSGKFFYPVNFVNDAVRINLNTYGSNYSQGGSSFDGVEGRCLACNIQILNNQYCSFDYGLRDVGTNYSVIWCARGY